MGRPPKILPELVLQAARELFSRDGLAASTKEIAAKSGLSEAALFKRYPTKSKLFLAAMLPPEIDMDGMSARAARAPDGREALLSYALDILAYFRKAMPVMLPAMMSPTIGLEKLVAHTNSGSLPQMTEAFAEFLQSQKQFGKNCCDTPLAVAGLLISSMHSLALFEIMGVHGGEFPDIAIVNMIDVIWRGIAPP